MSFAARTVQSATPFTHTLTTDLLQLSIAGVTIDVSGLSSKQQDLAALRFRPCITKGETALAQVSIATSANEAFASFGKELYYRISLKHDADHVYISGLNFSATLNRHTSYIQLSVSEDADSFLGSLENTLRVVCAYQLLARDTLLLHSVAITDERRGYVCIGRSGAGKSTLASLAHARGLRVLSDELNALPLDNASMQLRPLPFAGDFGRLSTNFASAPISGLYALEQARTTFLSRPSHAEALSRLIAACPYVNVDPFLTDKLDALAERIYEVYGMSTLHFAKSNDFWEVLAS